VPTDLNADESASLIRKILANKKRGSNSEKLVLMNAAAAIHLSGKAATLPDAFALASVISTICRELDVRLMRDWGTGHDEYWGKIGHFSIGWKACDEVSGALGTLMKKNQPSASPLPL
jgi:hypothetical protein